MTASRRSNWASRAKRVSAVAEASVVALAIAVIAACLAVLGVLAIAPERGEEWTSGLRPVQFYRELEADLLDDYAGVFAVAHNSGDTIPATLEALSYGADVVEVDVVSLDGKLYAAHGSPPIWFGDRFFRGPPLERVWIAAAGADAIKFDLKERSADFHELVLRFLAERRGLRRVIVVSDNPDVLRIFAEREPAVLRFLGVGSEDRFRLIEEDPSLVSVVDGVSVRHTLIDEERAAWLEKQGFLTLAWTVNDLERVNALVLLGVDAITTDNLAIVKLLGGERRGERRLDRIRTSMDVVVGNSAAAPSATPLNARTGKRRSPARTLTHSSLATPTTAGHHPASRSAAGQR